MTTKKNNEYLGIVVKQGECPQRGSYIFLHQSPFLHLFFVNEVEIEEVEEAVSAIKDMMNQVLTWNTFLWNILLFFFF